MKRSKGYPRTQFSIEDKTSIAEIPVSTISGTIPIYMAAYTSDKGTEDWELITTFDKFTDKKGPLSFSRHGQAQLLVANALTNGAYVYGKRMVSPDATLANSTIKARVIVTNKVAYVYLYSVTAENVKTFEEACTQGYGDFDPTKNPDTTTAKDDTNAQSYDIPLFTVAPLGRGTCNTQFTIIPEYYTSKTVEYTRYTFEIIEDSNVLEDISVTLNPDIIVDNINQSIQSKLAKNSSQFNAKIYEDGFGLLVNVLAKNATVTEKQQTVNLTVDELSKLDFINGFTKNGKSPIGGIITKATTAEESKSLWTELKPGDITTTYSFGVLDANGKTAVASEYIPVAGGSYGKMTVTPMANQEEYTKLLLGTYGKQQTNSEYYELFDPCIYNVDGYKIDAIFDCSYPYEVKDAIIDIADYRQDFVFIADLRLDCSSVDNAIENVSKISQSKFCAVYANTFNIVDPYTKKDIKVTMPLLLSTKLIDHIKNGVGRPFAGINNKLYFPQIDVKSINFIPIEMPGIDQKQQLVDSNINYLGLYDNTPVMETLYVNDDNYTQLSFLHNILAIQEVIKIVRSECPRIRYIFLDGGNDLQKYIDDVTEVINRYATNFKSISVEYASDEVAESNNIFYAVITVQFYNFIQEEKFKIIAIN